MTDRNRPLLSGLRDEFGSLAGEVAESLKLRLELAQLELAEDYRSGKRLALVLLAAVVMFLTSLPLLVVSLAEVLDGVGQVGRAGWLLVFATGLILVSTGASVLAWRRFRRGMAGLQETIEELREDLLWLQEWTAAGQPRPEDPFMKGDGNKTKSP